MAREFAIYSADKDAYYTTEYGDHTWSKWAFNAKGFDTQEQAAEFIRAMGWKNTTKAVKDGAYVVTLIK